MFEGKMTYIGVGVWIVGMLLGDLSNASEVQGIADNLSSVIGGIAEIVGTCMAIYGRYRIKQAKYE